MLSVARARKSNIGGKWGWNWFTILSILKRAFTVCRVTQSAADANRRWQQQTPTASLSECKVNRATGGRFLRPNNARIQYIGRFGSRRFDGCCVRTRPLPAACDRNWVWACLFVLIPTESPTLTKTRPREQLSKYSALPTGNSKLW